MRAKYMAARGLVFKNVPNLRENFINAPLLGAYQDYCPE
jgi:hypothetical protein